MKILRLIVIFLFCNSSFIRLSAQSYLEFVENKGQWDKQVVYKGELTTGAFILKADGGYRMVLHNHADLAGLTNSHQLKNISDTVVSKVTASTVNKTAASKSTTRTLHSHVYEVKFLNANPHPLALPDKPLTTYNNYFIGNDSSKWVSNCKVFNAITYKNIYPNIDVRYYTNNGQLKYDIIVNPGGDAHNIALYFDGVDALKLKEGILTVKTSVDEIKEMPPYSFSVQALGRKEVGCSYDVKGNVVRFRLEQGVSKTATLVIDPTLVFSTFSGSKASNWGYTATYDAAGNFYAGGIVFGAGFPVSNGAYQTNFGGNNPNGFDIGIIKLSPDGTNRVYATYLGGSGDEQPHSLVVDGAGNLIIAGRTSSADYPTKAPFKFGSCGGPWDIILSKLSADGQSLIGSLVIGGSGADGVNIQDKEVNCPGSTSNSYGKCDISLRRNYGDDARSEVILDAAGNIYLASSTQSSDFPTTSNAFQKTNHSTSLGYLQDAVVIKTSPDLSSILFSTLLGGSNDDAAFVLAINPIDQNIYVAGGTASADLPGISNAAVIQNTFQGGNCDGFVSIITNDGSSLIKTSYFGTANDENIYGIQFDKFGFPYIMGTTTGTTWPIKNATYHDVGGKQFIAKLLPDLTDYVYSTVFGTNSSQPNISPTAFLVDRCENVYVSGWGGLGNSGTGYQSSGTSGLNVSPKRLQQTTDGSDFYFFVLERNANSMLYGDWFGQNGGKYPDHVDGGTSRFDRNGIIYQAICANCNGPLGIFPTTAGVWSPNNAAINAGQGACNLAAIKIRFDLAGVSAGIQSAINGRLRDSSGCVPTAVLFSDTIGLAKQYIWNFNDGSPQQKTNYDTISHTFLNTGIYKVMMIGIDSSSCNISDTSYLTMRIRNDEAALSMAGNKLPPCTSMSYQFTNTSISPPGKPFGANSFLINFGDGSSQTIGAGTVTHTYAAIGSYRVSLVLVDSNYCNQADSASITIRLAPNVKAQFTTPALGCLPYTANFTNTSIGGTDFVWNFGDGTNSTQANTVHQYLIAGNYTIQLVANDSATCNKTDTASFAINVSGLPTASFTVSPQPPITNKPLLFTNNSLGGVSYKWYFGDGDSLLSSSLIGVNHTYNSTGTYNACLIAMNANGCTDTTCQNVNAIIIPLFDVPNAFSPNGDGVNDKVFINGFGITSMKWNIYNRWGTLVYESSDKAAGWDGTYKGKLQAQDVYHYTLQVVMSNGAKYSKEGDITLLR